MIIGALLMIKNEEESIKVTIDSLKDYIDTVIIYDTGSTDNTLSIVINCCQANKQTLHVKTTDKFNNFSESRNESLQFAETIDVNHLLLMDAGDEFKSTIPPKEFLTMMSSMPQEYNYGVLKLKWLENAVLTEHDGLRILRNKKNIRYDLRYPVHEQIILKDSPILPFPMIHLYQNRDMYGGSTNNRLKRDIHQLENAVKCRHNYYYLAQSYGAIGDIDNYYKYNVLALEFEDESVNDIFIYSRIIHCAIVKNMDKSIIFKYFNLAIAKNCELLELYLNMLKYCIHNRILDIIDPYLNKIASFNKNTSAQLNYEDFYYTRWSLISKYCLLANRHKDLGKKACKIAISVKNKPEDMMELRFYDEREVSDLSQNKKDDKKEESYSIPVSIENVESNASLPLKNGNISLSDMVITEIQDTDGSAPSTHVLAPTSSVQPNTAASTKQNTVGILIMLKNEETSIHATLESTKTHFEHIIVFDTGSTDNTISIIKQICKKNGQTLHLKVTNEFKGFPRSRNEAIEFAETVDVKYLLLMDAGDEFQTSLHKKDFVNHIKNIPTYVRFGVVRQDWKCMNNTSTHSDIRFIKNKANCRYDLDYPVHEKFIVNETMESPIQFRDMFILFQDRYLYGGSTEDRYFYDIEVLSKAKKRPRNYYFLAQTYMDIQDFKNGYIYNKKVVELAKATNNNNIDICSVLIRLLYCAISCDMDKSVIHGHFKEAINFNKQSNVIIDAYVYYLHYCIKTNQMDGAVSLLEPLSKLELNQNDLININHFFYSYERWHVISVVSLMTKQKMGLGKRACQKAIDVANKPQDINNMSLFTLEYFARSGI
jgi:glycosyltransferase involved in cell wall biosynthesis